MCSVLDHPSIPSKILVETFLENAKKKLTTKSGALYLLVILYTSGFDWKWGNYIGSYVFKWNIFSPRIRNLGRKIRKSYPKHFP